MSTEGRFRQKISDSAARFILYEVIPPPTLGESSHRQAFFHALDRILSNVSVDAVNIPEVREESGQTGEKGAHTLPKGDPRIFAREFLSRHPDIAVIVNHVVVHDPFDSFTKWVKETSDTYGIAHAVFVGGESSAVRYPGPSVREAALWVRDKFNSQRLENNKLLVGGITIPTRRHLNPGHDEPARLFNKSQDGIEFFTSQVIYESESAKRLLTDYDAFCKAKQVFPKRIILSFAPVSTPKDITFLRWLGVRIPLSVEQQLHEGWIGMGWRSVEICTTILQDILQHISAHQIRVPVGINVEHIMKYNVELSKELLVTLSQLLSK